MSKERHSGILPDPEKQRNMIINDTGTIYLPILQMVLPGSLEKLCLSALFA